MGNLTILFIILLVVTGFGIWLHRQFRVPESPKSMTPEQLEMNKKQFSVRAENGKLLDTWFLEPKASDLSDVTVIVVHGWGANKNVMLPLAKPFYAAGINVCLFDSRSHGDSESDRFSSMPKFASDIASVYHHLHQQYPQHTGSVFLLGHSVGAGAVLLAASKNLPVKGVISISAFAHPEFAMRRFLTRFEKIPALTPAILKYVQWVIGYKFDDIAPMNTVKRVCQPVMIVHGSADTTVPVDDGYLIYQNAQEGVSEQISFLEVEGADHDGVEKIEHHQNSLIDFVLSHMESQ